jgi:hypothetical protein
MLAGPSILSAIASDEVIHAQRIQSRFFIGRH